MSTTVWTKEVQAGDPGATVTVPLTGGNAKYNLTAAVYSGVASTPTLVFGTPIDGVDNTVRTTPVVGADDGSWVVSYWSDKSSTTTAWTTVGGDQPGRRLRHLECPYLQPAGRLQRQGAGDLRQHRGEHRRSVVVGDHVVDRAADVRGAPGGEPAAGRRVQRRLRRPRLRRSTRRPRHDDGAIASRAWTFGDARRRRRREPVAHYAGLRHLRRHPDRDRQRRR